MANRVVFVGVGRGNPWPDIEPVRGITLYWVSWEGIRYNLTDRAGGVFIANEGLEGLGFPDITHYETTSPMVHGSAYDGWLVEGRKVFWNLAVYQPGRGQNFVSLAQQVLRSFRPGKTGRWIAEMPDGTQYGLTLRYRSGLNAPDNTDPSLRGYKVYPVEFIVEQPFWEGPETTVFWQTGSDVDFYGPTGYGPPFFISQTRKLEDATVTNVGDVEAYATWELNGPFTSASVGIDGRTTPINFPVADGETLVLDTNPRTGLTATLNGADVMERIPGFQYPPIPPGEELPIALAMAGSGSIRARFRPLYLGLV